MTYREELLELADGRTLEVATMGNPSGETVFFHHGTPGTTRTVKSLEGLSRLRRLLCGHDLATGVWTVLATRGPNHRVGDR